LLHGRGSLKAPPKKGEHPVLDKALPQVTQLQGFQPHSKSQPAKLGCSQRKNIFRFPLLVGEASGEVRGGRGRGLTPQLIDQQYPGKSRGVGKRLTELAQTDFNLGNSSTYIQVESALFGIFPSQNDEHSF
jgi:hypothetical protein